MLAHSSCVARRRVAVPCFAFPFEVQATCESAREREAAVPTANFFPTDGRSLFFSLLHLLSAPKRRNERKARPTDRPTETEVVSEIRPPSLPPSHARTKPPLFFCSPMGRANERGQGKLFSACARLIDKIGRYPFLASFSCIRPLFTLPLIFSCRKTPRPNSFRRSGEPSQ